MKEGWILATVSVLLALASAGALVGLILTGPVLSLDGLSLLAVCLLMFLVFSWFSLSTIREQRLLEAASAKAKQVEAAAPPEAKVPATEGGKPA